MRRKKSIAPSILSANFSRLGEEIAAVERGGADFIHVDVMDGHFVPNITIGPVVLESLKGKFKIPNDVHLMIENPDLYISDFAKAGSDIITVQAETCYHLHRTIQVIKENGVKPGIALNPATSLCTIEEVIDDLYLVLIMSVNPGFGGQKFIPFCLDKIRRLKKMIDDRKLDILIEVDGGVKLDNIKEIADAGADILVAGSAIFCTESPEATTRKMKKIIAG
ncbi:ribulose-phosphate 3-epimerase [bacterium]|nr:ribulose-phosphate 3-epimerase [bacterium]